MCNGPAVQRNRSADRAADDWARWFFSVPCQIHSTAWSGRGSSSMRGAAGSPGRAGYSRTSPSACESGVGDLPVPWRDPVLRFARQPAATRAGDINLMLAGCGIPKVPGIDRSLFRCPETVIMENRPAMAGPLIIEARFVNPMRNSSELAVASEIHSCRCPLLAIPDTI
jgi:hypothetical protein